MTVVPWRYARLIAHRCGGALAPENTLAGLYVAARLGYAAVEFDVMLSRDGQPVVIHDESLARTTNGQGEVAALLLAELLDLDAGCRHHKAFAQEALPSLLQVLSTCQRLGLAANVEIKPSTGHEVLTGRVVAQALGDFVAGLAPAAEGTENVSCVPLLVSSFSMEALESALATGLPEGVAWAWLVETLPRDWQQQLVRLGTRRLHVGASGLSAAQCGQLSAAGVEIACYTVNDVRHAAQLYDAGVVSLFTDRLDLFDGQGRPWRAAFTTPGLA